MNEMDKMLSGLEYCYDDEEISMMKLHAIENETYSIPLLKTTWTNSMKY